MTAKAKVRKVPPGAQAKALAIVAAWMGRKGYGEPFCPAGRTLAMRPWGRSTQHEDDGSECEDFRLGPAPTGKDAAYAGHGPMLVPDWAWTGTPTPTVILEGGPYDWALDIAGDSEVSAAMRAINVFAEPYSGWALSLYRWDVAIGS